MFGLHTSTDIQFQNRSGMKVYIHIRSEIIAFVIDPGIPFMFGITDKQTVFVKESAWNIITGNTPPTGDIQIHPLLSSMIFH